MREWIASGHLHDQSNDDFFNHEIIFHFFVGNVDRHRISRSRRYEKAAAGNSSEAMFQLGLMTQDGHGGPKTTPLRKHGLRKLPRIITAARSNESVRVKEEGRAGPKDEKAAIAFYKKAADLGDDDAADALHRLRCQFTMKDKDKVVGHIWYTGD